MKLEIVHQGNHPRRTAIALILTAALACVWLNSAAATEVYTWTDEEGVVHFSDSPLPSGDSEKINVEGAYMPGTTGAYSSAADTANSPAGDGESQQSAARQRREELAKTRDDRREAQAEIEQLCTRHRARLEQVEPARRVFITDENGESVRLDDGQRMEMINESRDYIAKNCE